VRIALRILAVLIALRGVGNLLKRFGAGSGLVFFGQLLPRETLLAPLLGLVMLVYACGLWRESTWALPLGIVYAVFATVNLLLFPFVTGLPQGVAPALYAVFVVGGVVMCWGAVRLLQKLRAAR